MFESTIEDLSKKSVSALTDDKMKSKGKSIFFTDNITDNKNYHFSPVEYISPDDYEISTIEEEKFEQITSILDEDHLTHLTLKDCCIGNYINLKTEAEIITSKPQKFRNISMDNLKKVLHSEKIPDDKQVEIRINVSTPVKVSEEILYMIIPIRLTGKDLDNFEQHLKKIHKIDKKTLDQMKNSLIKCDTTIKLVLNQYYAVTETYVFETCEPFEFAIKYETANILVDERPKHTATVKEIQVYDCFEPFQKLMEESKITKEILMEEQPVGKLNLFFKFYFLFRLFNLFILAKLCNFIMENLNFFKYKTDNSYKYLFD